MDTAAIGYAIPDGENSAFVGWGIALTLDLAKLFKWCVEDSVQTAKTLYEPLCQLLDVRSRNGKG